MTRISRTSAPGFRSRKPLLIAATSVIALYAASPAFAQNAAPASSPTASDIESAQEVVVTGIRGSLQRNLDIKRNAPGVVDAISAEDIGKFPDSNVASALQRLPGVSIQRSGPRGEATGVSIRGFGGDFVDTLYDGRHISTATGNRGVDFTTVGADFVGRLSVYKTPDVELSTSAIGGTIDVQFPKPFDRPGFHAAATASGSYQDRAKKAVPTGGVLLSDTFADDTIGVLADLAYSRHDTKSNHVFIPGWIGQQGTDPLTGATIFGVFKCQLTAVCNTSPGSTDKTSANRTGHAAWVPQQTGIDQSFNKDERIDGRVAVQWKPTDSLLLTIDDNFSRQTLHFNDFGYAAWFNGGDLRNIKLDSNGTAVDFNQFGTPMDFNAQQGRNIYETNQAGVNLKWDIMPGLKFEVDGAIARSTRNPGRNGRSDSMDIGYGGTNCYRNAPGTYNTEQCGTDAQGPIFSSNVLGANTGVAIQGPSSDYYPQIHDIGPAGNVSRFTDPTVIGSHVIVRGAAYNTDLVKQLRAGLGWDKDGFSVKLGGQYIEDTLHGENTSTFSNGVFASRSGYGTCSGRTGGSGGGICPLPASVYQGSISTSGFIPGYKGSLGPSIIVYDPYQVYALLEQSGGSVKPTLDPGSIFDITEKTYAIFFKTSFESDVAGMPFHVSAGVRDEGTHLSSGAKGRQLLGLARPAGDPTLIQPDPALGPLHDGFSATTDIIGKSNYNFLLPSIDAKLNITPSLLVRLDASRTLTRPSLNNLKPTVSLGTLRVGSLSASGGNPNLKPYLSDNFDAGGEWYYQRNSYLAVNFYLKHITNFIVGGVTTQTINGVIDPSTGQVAKFTVNAQVNGPEATVKGVEIALQQVFGDTGFGFQANATLPSTNRKYDPANVTGGAFSITGLAKSANLVAFYDKHGIQARVAVNWRDEYLLNLGQGQGGTYGAEPVYVNQQTQVDASASYDVNKQFTVFVEGTNLNNSNYSTHGRFKNQVLDIYNYGRRYAAGVRFHY